MGNFGADGFFGNNAEQQAADDARNAANAEREAQAAREVDRRKDEGYDPGGSNKGGSGGCAVLLFAGIVLFAAAGQTFLA